MTHRHFHTSSSCNTESPPPETLLCSSWYGCVHVIPTHANSSFCDKELLGLFLSRTDQLLDPAAGVVTHSDLAELLHHTHPRRTFSIHFNHSKNLLRFEDLSDWWISHWVPMGRNKQFYHYLALQHNLTQFINSEIIRPSARERLTTTLMERKECIFLLLW